MNRLDAQAPDQAQRDEALNTAISCIVQAPAGSGKTELLTQRFVKLLSEVDEPEQILAITFTRAATAEMRFRVLQQLEKARSGPRGPALEMARRALAHAEARGWKLLEQPHRLNIQTIDSLCMRLAHEQPLLARMGGHLQPQDDASLLYEEAARRTLAYLGSPRHEIHAALMHVLAMRDNHLGDVQRLIAEMLAKRDQWLHVFPLSNQISEEQWTKGRRKLEAPFQHAVKRVLEQAHSLLSRSQLLVSELLELGRYASQYCGEFALLAELRELPNTGLVDHWKCLVRFLTRDKDWRRQYSKTQGFPADEEKHLPEGQRPSRRIKALVQQGLRTIPGLLATLNEIADLPPLHYSEEQWHTLRQFFVVLRYAVAELRVLFAERNAIDFIELGIAALQVLEDPTDNVLRLGEQVRHLLVDEFQDTSRRQLRLLEMLLRVWEPGGKQTCFLVGDPMQSIYMFRQAEVELFGQVLERGIEHHAFQPIRLSANFRSHRGLTERLNQWFQPIFHDQASDNAAAVSFSPSIAVQPAPPVESVVLHPQFISSRNPQEVAAAAQHEAEEIVQIIHSYRERIQRAEEDPEDSFTVAVLARARQHLALIAQKLRENGIPYRSVEIESLGQCQEVRDLMSLTRALLHPMDRIAWLSVLRAPWCGLTLQDLHTLCGEDDRRLARVPLQHLMEERLALLSSDGQQRLGRVLPVLRKAQQDRYQEGQSLSTWIERTWNTLGGPLCLDQEQKENARVFFSMLDGFSSDGIACLGEALDRQLERLFAQPDPRVSERAGVQLMTIHKAKGLGFNVVLVPGLEHKARRDDKPLIIMLQRASATQNADELLVAPIDSRGGNTHPLYRWVRKQREIREEEERKRVFYVACTRARDCLHLFGTATVTKEGKLQPGSGTDTLLCAAWPALEEEFLTAYQRQQQQKILPFSVPQSGTVAIAAAAAPLHPPLVLRRLPADVSPPVAGTNVQTPGTVSAFDTGELFARPEGGRAQRLIGSLLHVLLERLSQMQISAEEASSWMERHTSALLRTAALPEELATRAYHEIVASLQAVLEDPQGRWLLFPHPDAQSEASWTGWLDGMLRTVRADRVFRAGSLPLSTGKEFLWVVDYKTTSYAGKDVDQFLAAQRKQYASQLATYGHALQKIHGNALRLRFGLYFPRLKRLEYWSD